MKLLNNIHKATIHTFTLPPHHTTNGYVIGGDREAVLVDPIYSPGNLLDACLKENGIRLIQYAAVTHPHPDHYGGIDRLLESYGGKVLCHRSVADDAIFSASNGRHYRRFAGGETIETDSYTVRVLHTPGHSPAHLCFYIPEEGILFSGDTVLGQGTAIISPPEGDMADYMNTLNVLATMDIRMICPAHGPVIDQHAAERIQWYIAHRMTREVRVLEALKTGLSEVPLITRQIYDEADFKMHGRDLQPRAERTVLAHLEKLIKEGVVIRQKNAHAAHYYLA